MPAGHHTIQRKRSIGAALLALLATLLLTCMAGTPAYANGLSNPDRGNFPIIAGSEVGVPNGYCSVGAVLVPSSIFQRITPYQRAVRYLVLAKHCAPLNSPIYFAQQDIGDVVWQSAASDIELVRVSPSRDNMTLHCAGHSTPATCSPIQTFTPRANGQVFMTAPPSPIVGRRAIAGTGIPSATGTFCTSGHVTGVICDFQPTSLPVGVLRAYEHLAAGQSAAVGALRPGDSGGPVVSKDRRLLGIISGDVPNTHFLVYTPMAQVLHELSSYKLAPAN